MVIFRNRRLLPVSALVVLVFTGCWSRVQTHTFRATPELLQKRELRTRKYQSITEAEILSASAGVLQDLGFTIDESETTLGLIVGSKEVDATEIAQEVAWWIMALISLGTSTLDEETDDYQRFRASVVVRPISEDNDRTHKVSVTFQRVVWDTADKVSQLETLDAPEIYQEFFDRLSKSVFLEGQKL